MKNFENTIILWTNLHFFSVGAKVTKKVNNAKKVSNFKHLKKAVLYSVQCEHCFTLPSDSELKSHLLQEIIVQNKINLYKDLLGAYTYVIISNI